MSLVADVENMHPVKLKQKYGQDILDFVENEAVRLDNAEKEMSNAKYRIPVEYKLALTKSPGEADITLSSGQGQRVGLILEVAKDLSKTHPYLQKDAIKEINEKLEDNKGINQHDFQALLHKEKVKGQSRFHHKITKPEIHRYSKELIDLAAEKINQDRKYLVRARESLKSHRSKKTKEKVNSSKL